ncbi:MAG: hypothetical protein WCR80_06020 [Bacilli bacterium]
MVEKAKKIFIPKKDFDEYPFYLKSSLSYWNKGVDELNTAGLYLGKDAKKFYFHLNKSKYYRDLSRKMRADGRVLYETEKEVLKKKYL